MVVWRSHPSDPRVRIPVLHLREPGNVVSRPYQPAMDFSFSISAKSEPTLLKLPQTLGLIWDALIETGPDFSAATGEAEVKMFLMSVYRCLRYGTEARSSTKLTMSALRWPRRSPEVVFQLGRAFDEFNRFMSDRPPDPDDPFLKRCRNLYRGTFKVAIREDTGREFSSVAHPIKSRRGGGQATSEERPEPTLLEGIIAPGDKRPPYFLSPTKRFPREHLLEFLTKAFTYGNPNKPQRDVTGEFAAKLLVGGTRGAEELHLWANDLQITRSGELLGFLRHPSQYIEPSIGKTRADILAEVYDRRPRHEEKGRMWAGWKSPALNGEQWAFITWLAGYEDLLKISFIEYILNVRVPAMEERKALGLRDHPYLLVFPHSIPHLGVNAGDPYTIGAFNQSWKRGMNRMRATTGDALFDHAKNLGTTKHAVRHLSGHTWIQDGLGLAGVMKILHHKSPISTSVYTLPDDAEVHKMAEEVKERIKSGQLSDSFRRPDTIEEAVRKYGEGVLARYRHGR